MAANIRGLIGLGDAWFRLGVPISVVKVAIFYELLTIVPRIVVESTDIPPRVTSTVSVVPEE